MAPRVPHRTVTLEPRAYAPTDLPPETNHRPRSSAPPRLAPTEAARRWAALLQQIFEVDPHARSSTPRLPPEHAPFDVTRR